MIKRISHEINASDNNTSRLMASIDLKKLKKKTEALFHGKLGEFDWKERRNLPFLLVDYLGDEEITTFILDHINFDKTSGFRRSIFAYFINYSNVECSMLLRNRLVDAIEKDKEKLNRVVFLKHNPNLLNSDGVCELAKMFTIGIENYLNAIELPLGLYTSRFVLRAIKLFFFKEMSTLDKRMELLQEIQHNESYRFLIPQIVSPIIVAVQREKNKSHRGTLMQIIHREMGDPRVGTKASKWAGVSETAKKIYFSWLKENDLELFFEIIDSTACDRMWRYRKAFWQAYLDDIEYTKVVLGPIAEQKAKLVAKDKLLNYGRLYKAYDKTQSLLVFSIGEYIFMEVSHNGSLRIWKKEKCPFLFFKTDFGHDEYSYDFIIHTYYEIESFVHSSPETYSWQRNISEWIAKHCGINRTALEWGVNKRG